MPRTSTCEARAKEAVPEGRRVHVAAWRRYGKPHDAQAPKPALGTGDGSCFIGLTTLSNTGRGKRRPLHR